MGAYEWVHSFLILAVGRVSGQLHASAASPPGMQPSGPIEGEDWGTPEPVWKLATIPR